jgi:hypothetical protein
MTRQLRLLAALVPTSGIGRTTRIRWDDKMKALAASGDKTTAASIKTS